MPRDHYEILGTSFSLETDSGSVRDFFRAAYRRFRTPAGSAPGQLQLLAIMNPRDGEAYAAAGRERLCLSGTSMPENRAFIFLLNALMARVSRFLLLHGAAFSLHGRGYVLCGPATAGKSTLALALARRGAVFFGDDVAPIERSTGLLHPFPRAVGIRKESGTVPAFDPSGLPDEVVHDLPHKWLVDPAALGLSMPRALEGAVPLEAVILMDPSMGARGRSDETRSFEIALTEDDGDVLAEIGSIEGISELAAIPSSGYPRYRFEAGRRSRPMAAVAETCRRHPDVVLYLEQLRTDLSDRAGAPLIEEASWPPLLIELSRDLLNRVEGGALAAECGGLAGLVAEMGRVLHRARAFRLRPGSLEDTVDLVLNLPASHPTITRGVQS